MRIGTVILLALVVALRPAPAAEWEFTALHNLRGSGEFGASSCAYGLSADGQAAVGASLSSIGLGVTRGDEAFLWIKPGPMQGLGALSPPGAEFFSTAYDVSDHGRVVVGESETGQGRQAFRWTRAEGMVGLGTLEPSATSAAYGVSADGQVIVGVQGKAAFRWTQEHGLMLLGDLPGGLNRSAATAVSSDGKVVVGYGSTNDGTEAFRWTAESGMQGLGDLAGGSFSSMAEGVSRDGAVVVGRARSASGAEAFRWTAEEGMTALGDLPGGEFWSGAKAVSGDGKVVVGRATGPTGPAAFVWTAEHGMQSLTTLVHGVPSASGWQLEDATDISDDATVIVGTGTNPQKEKAAWLIRLRQPPTTADRARE